MTNALLHRIEVTDTIVVETAGHLSAAVNDLSDDSWDDLDATYVVSRLEEHLSDGSIKVSISIRRAEAV